MKKTILITGASSGIGAAVAERFLAEGWTVGLMARRASPLETLAGKGDGVVLPGDVTDETDVQSAVDALVASAGRIDVLFNNAGVFPPATRADQVTTEDWHRAVNTNVTGMFLVARAVFRQMLAQDPSGGRIINNGSLSAHSPRYGSLAYTTTKHAITGMTKAMGLDGRALGISVGQIDIGNADTPMVEDLNAALEARGETPLPTMAVGDAADAVWYMANLPPEANVPFLTVMATQMPYLGRG